MRIVPSWCGSTVAGPPRLGRAHVWRGQVLARGDVVVVTVNYRLGALGFLTHPDLEDANGVCGNWGVLDLIAALQSVGATRSGTFGGDTANVTLLGESAGGTLVSFARRVGRAASGLFHRHDRAERRTDRGTLGRREPSRRGARR